MELQLNGFSDLFCMPGHDLEDGTRLVQECSQRCFLAFVYCCFQTSVSFAVLVFKRGKNVKNILVKM